MQTRRWALTVVEILVIVALLAFLAALLLPATQSAREAGRRNTEANERRIASVEFEETGLSQEGLRDKAQAAVQAVNGDNRLPPSATPPADRKIIYTAQIELMTDNFTGTSDRVVELVKQFEGYVADSIITGTSGENRRAAWRLRVPIARFDDFIASAKGLGELVGAKTNSQDVSEEYYDVDARIRNKTKEEERLIKLLEERPGKLEDVIAIERELSRVREDLERMQGRMRVLADRTSLTSVQITLAEVYNYRPAEAPSFATRIRRTMTDSLSALQSSAETLVIVAVGMTPWLVAFAVLLAAAYPFARPVLRRMQAAKSPTA